MASSINCIEHLLVSFNTLAKLEWDGGYDTESRFVALAIALLGRKCVGVTTDHEV